MIVRGHLQNESVKEVLIAGLKTDGAHHKQWSLELALELLIGSTEFESLKELKEWEEGIVP